MIAPAQKKLRRNVAVFSIPIDFDYKLKCEMIIADWYFRNHKEEKK